MNSYIQKLRLPFLVFAVLLSFASDCWAARDGNGGDGIVCYKPDGNVQSIELLDYYEARLMGIRLDVFDSTNEFTALNQMIERLKVLSPARYAKFKVWAGEFLRDAEFSPTPLPDIPDTGLVIIPAGCKMQQMAFQIVPSGNAKRYVVSKALWDAADIFTKAGLMFHELIYRDSLVYDLEDSSPVRGFNRIVTSAEMPMLKTQKEFFTRLFEIKFPASDICGGINVNVDLSGSYENGIHFYPSGAVESGGVWSRGPGSPGPQRIYQNYDFFGRSLPLGFRTDCYESGHVKSVWLSSSDLNFQMTLTKNKVDFIFQGANPTFILSFYGDGSLHKIMSSAGFDKSMIKIKSPGLNLKGNTVMFYPSGEFYGIQGYELGTISMQAKEVPIRNEALCYKTGEPLLVTPSLDTTLMDFNGKSISVRSSDRVLLDQNGFIKNLN